MAYARDEYTATASQTDFTITYPFLSRDHVTVYSVGVLQTVTTDYTFLSDTSIRLVTGATAGDVIVLLRSTSRSTRSVDFTSGTLTEADLDNSALQMFYLSQEALDIAADSMTLNTAGNWDGQTRLINDVVDPVVPQDAATKAYVDAVSIGAIVPSVDALVYNPAPTGTAATTIKSALDSLRSTVDIADSTVTDAYILQSLGFLTSSLQDTRGDSFMSGERRKVRRYYTAQADALPREYVPDEHSNATAMAKAGRAMVGAFKATGAVPIYCPSLR